MIQGDEGAILLQWLYSRLRGNSASWKVNSMPTDPSATFPCVGFNFHPATESAKEQGGQVMYSSFTVNVLAIGALGVDDIAPLRTVAKELASNLAVVSGQPGTRIGSGMILSSTMTIPMTYSDRDKAGQVRWYHGHQWLVKVQPDVAAS